MCRICQETVKYVLHLAISSLEYFRITVSTVARTEDGTFPVEFLEELILLPLIYPSASSNLKTHTVGKHSHCTKCFLMQFLYL